MANTRYTGQANWPFPKATDDERPRGHEFLPHGGGGNHVIDAPRYETKNDLYRQGSVEFYGPRPPFGHYAVNDIPEYQHGGSPEGRWGEGTKHKGQNHFDPDYHQWRSEQISNLDRDYHEYRQERYRKFADDFDKWRTNRTEHDQPKSAGSANLHQVDET